MDVPQVRHLGHPPEVGGGHVLDRGEHRRHRVVHPHVDRPELAPRPARPPARPRRRRPRRPAGPAPARRAASTSRAAASSPSRPRASSPTRRPVPGELPDDRPADPGRRPGDHHHLRPPVVSLMRRSPSRAASGRQSAAHPPPNASVPPRGRSASPASPSPTRARCCTISGRPAYPSTHGARRPATPRAAGSPTGRRGSPGTTAISAAVAASGPTTWSFARAGLAVAERPGRPSARRRPQERARVGRYIGSPPGHADGGERSGRGPLAGRRSPQNARHADRPARCSACTYCRLASTSSIAGPIITTEMTAVTRQSSAPPADERLEDDEQHADRPERADEDARTGRRARASSATGGCCRSPRRRRPRGSRAPRGPRPARRASARTTAPRPTRGGSRCCRPEERVPNTVSNTRALVQGEVGGDDEPDRRQRRRSAAAAARTAGL